MKDMDAVRLIGLEGGVASGGYLGVFELAVLNRIPHTVELRNPGFRMALSSSSLTSNRE